MNSDKGLHPMNDEEGEMMRISEAIELMLTEKGIREGDIVDLHLKAGSLSSIQHNSRELLGMTYKLHGPGQLVFLNKQEMVHDEETGEERAREYMIMADEIESISKH